MYQNYQMSVSGKNIRIFSKVVIVILEIKKDQFWCGKAFGRRLMTWDCTPERRTLERRTPDQFPRNFLRAISAWAAMIFSQHMLAGLVTQRRLVTDRKSTRLNSSH